MSAPAQLFTGQVIQTHSAMPYAAFAGRDASRGLAKNSFDPTMVRQIDEEIDTLDDLSAEEQAALDEWSNFFASKYIHVGTLVAQNREQ